MSTYAANISARLGVDTRPFSDGMNRAATDGARAGDKIAQSTNRAVTAQNALLRSSQNVAGQIGNVAREMLSGGNAAQVFSIGLEGIGRSMRLGLGWLSALFVGGAIVGKIAEAAKEAKKLQAEIARVVRPQAGERYEAMDTLITKLDEVKKKTGEAKSVMGGFWHSVWKGLKAAATSGGDFKSGGAGAMNDVNKDDAKALKSLNRRGRSLREMITDGARRRNDQANEESNGGDSFKGNRLKAFNELMLKSRAAMLDKNMALLGEEMRAYAITIKEINRKQAEASKTTLEDLAENATNGSRHQGYKTVPFQGRELGLQEAAQKALEEKAAYDKARLGGRNPDEEYGANYHKSRYNALVGGMSDIVKSGDVRALELRGAALDILRTIEQNTAKQFSHK